MLKINKKNLYNWISIISMIVMYLIMCLLASKQSFWGDELDWTIEFLEEPSIKGMLARLLESGYNLPLYYLLMFPIYKIAPYGELWILLPNIIIVLIGVYIMKKIGEKIAGKDLGLICLGLCTTSFILIYKIAFELRPYALLFCLSALSIYTYICKLENDNKKNNLFFIINIILLSYTHWFGCLISAVYFLIDTYLCIRKKISIKYIFQYIILGITFLPWFILVMINHTTNFNEYWANKPGINTIISMLRYLLSNNAICKALFLVGIFTFVILIIMKKIKGNKNYYKYFGLCITTIILATGIIFIYSRYIKPRGSLFVDRYFFSIMPQVLIVCAIPLYELLNLRIALNNEEQNISINGIEINKTLLTIVVIGILLIIGYKNYNTLYKKCSSYDNPYREMSDIIVNTSEVYEDDNAVLVNEGTTFLRYYIEKRGYKLPSNVFVGKNNIKTVVKNGERVEQTEIEKEELLKYNKICVCTIQKLYSEDMIKFINDNYTLIGKAKGLEMDLYERTNNENVE